MRHAPGQLASHEIVLGATPGLLVQGNPRYFVPFINCAKAPTSQETRIQDHERLGQISFKRMRQLNVDGITPPTSKRLKPITCPVCITAKARRAILGPAP